MKTIADLRRDFRRLASPARAESSTWFFKTARGQYGYGDKFLGLSVPQQRQLAKKYRTLPLTDVVLLLRSPYHEHRLTAVLMLGDQFRRGTALTKKKIVTAYLANRKFVNNWDIVDSSAPHILGAWLFDRPRTQLYLLAKSRSLWDRRIAILATQYFIRRNDFTDTLKLAKLLLSDPENLIHKAVGWMLREVGEHQPSLLITFLKKYETVMPRTMLRYAIERFPPAARRRYLTAV